MLKTFILPLRVKQQKKITAENYVTCSFKVSQYFRRDSSFKIIAENIDKDAFGRKHT